MPRRMPPHAARDEAPSRVPGPRSARAGRAKRSSGLRLGGLGGALALAIVVAPAVAPAPAGVPLVDAGGATYRWDLDLAGQPNVDSVTKQVTFFVDDASLRDTVVGVPPGTAIRSAVRAWEVPTSRIRFKEDSARPASARSGSDRVNWIGWSTTELGAATFAATFPTRSGSRVLDMDVVMNDRFRWVTATPGEIGNADIQSLVAHEWGHAVGCDHVPLRLSTMYYAAETGQTSLRSIEPDDAALVGSLYPNELFDATTASIRGKVSVVGVGDDRAVHVIAVSVATAEPAASALTKADGSFSIGGLPFGTYRLVAAPCAPLGNVMNSYWRSGSTSFVPAALGDGGSPPVRTRALRLDVPGPLDAGTIQVSAATVVFEPNDEPGTARAIAVGDAVAARLETSLDQDWYTFDASQGERLTISVLAWELGSDVDPSLRLTDVAGNALRSSSDIRTAASHATDLAGIDRDARIVGWPVPATGRYLVRVGQDKPATGPFAFYVLFVTAASDAPSAQFTDVTATPMRIDAGGAVRSTIVVRPRREDGEDVGGGATVQFPHTGAGIVGPVTAHPDGTYSAEITAPQDPGEDTFGVVVTNSAGAATLQDAVTIVYVGPADPAASSLRADPRRVLPGETTTVQFTPRDAAGEALGTFRNVALTLDALPDADFGPVTASGEGTFTASLTAGSTTGAATISARVDAQDAVVTAPFAVGFALADVLAAAAADVTAFRATPGISRRATRDLATAATRIAAAATVAGDDAKLKTALARTASAIGPLRSALARSPALDDPGTPRELALAVRTAAAAAVAAAVPRNGREQDRIDRAESVLAAGDGRFASGNAAGAVTRWLRAFRSVAGLQP